VNFEAEAIYGGTFDLKNVSSSKIGSIKESTIRSEFSKIEIGEVGLKTIIIDFNSEYWLYNWENNFGKVLMTTEYSKINIFTPKDIDYHLATFGHDTVHFFEGFTSEIRPSRENKSSYMFDMGSSRHHNKIQVNTVHGIIRFGEDIIDLKQ
jgi:hypothetical protein